VFVIDLLHHGPQPSNSLTSFSPPGVPHWRLGFQQWYSIPVNNVNILECELQDIKMFMNNWLAELEVLQKLLLITQSVHDVFKLKK